MSCALHHATNLVISLTVYLLMGLLYRQIRYCVQLYITLHSVVFLVFTILYNKKLDTARFCVVKSAQIWSLDTTAKNNRSTGAENCATYSPKFCWVLGAGFGRGLGLRVCVFAYVRKYAITLQSK